MSNLMSYHADHDEYVGTDDDGREVRVSASSVSESLRFAAKEDGVDLDALFESDRTAWQAVYDKYLDMQLDPNDWPMDDYNSEANTEMSSREHENAMIVDLCHEAGDTGSNDELIEGFRANHHAEDIAAAASGDVAALAALRQACGLPVIR